MKRLRHLRGEAGASSVELLVFFPLLLLIILLAVQTGLSWYGAMTAARETARTLRTGAHDDAALAAARADGAAYAQSLAGSGLTDVVVEASVDGGAVTVTVTGSAMDVFGGLTPRGRATVTSPIEEFRGDS